MKYGYGSNLTFAKSVMLDIAAGYDGRYSAATQRILRLEWSFRLAPPFLYHKGKLIASTVSPIMLRQAQHKRLMKLVHV